MRPPSVDALAQSLADTGLPHPLLVDAARAAIAAGDPDSARTVATARARRLLAPVINATGVLLHTNLGRAPFALSTPGTYSNVELDLATGRRGSRHEGVGALVAQACGAEAAAVVNNGAAAVLLVAAALAAGSEVVVSRGELVEIGGGFRVPEVIEQSGARLVEVGTTNRTRVADYRNALARRPAPALALKIHRSNYRITGFTEDVDIAEVAGAGREFGVPLVVDLGSGLLDARCPWLPGGPPGWLRDEPAAVQSLTAGAALVTFSGDKLFGGPQAGVIAGRRELVERCVAHPLARAFRAGTHVLWGMQEVALAYLRREAAAIPFWRMAMTPPDDLRDRAERLGAGEPVPCASTPGGGTLPGVDIASWGVALDGDRTAALRAASVPVIARVEQGRTILDLRTVAPADDEVLVAAIEG